MFLSLLPHPVSALTLDSGRVHLGLDRDSGLFSIDWSSAGKVDHIFGSARLADGRLVKTTEFPDRAVSRIRVHDSLGNGQVLTVKFSKGQGGLSLTEKVWVYGGRTEAFFQLSVEDPSGKGVRQITPVASDAGVQFAHDGPLNSLFVPYDNDSYFRFHSEAWNEPEGSYEVGAVYDDQSRGGVVVGSIDHDLWKSAVKFDRQGGVQAYCGVTSKYTHDKVLNGVVTGSSVSSPRFAVGLYKDWRGGLEQFGALNAKVQPALKWDGPVPFGWNSWSGYKDKITLAGMDAAVHYFTNEVPWVRDGGTAYINFDSFWDNLTRYQRVELVERIHAAGLKAGIYWTPFVNWGEPDWKSVGGYHFRDMQLKDDEGKLLPKLDGGWPLDPTHPGTLQRIDENLKDFVAQGFDYVKLDFLTHGALEARHFDSKVQTGTAAYRVGMQRIVDDLSPAKIGRPFFLSLSIAPMFPNGYAHSRRISCDIFANIGASEYFLNSQNYAWWTANRLYRFNDPDSACEYQAKGEPSTTDAEARTRFTASLIGGSMMIEGDDLANPAAEARVKSIFSNRAALELARRAPQFRPVSGTTGDKAGVAFVHRESDRVVYVAAFNYSKTEVEKLDLGFERLNLPPGVWATEDLWTHKRTEVTDRLSCSLAPMDCALIRLAKQR